MRFRISLILLVLIVISQQIFTLAPQYCTVTLEDENGSSHYYDFSQLMRYDEPYSHMGYEGNLYITNVCANVPDFTAYCPCCGINTNPGWMFRVDGSCIPMAMFSLEDGISLDYYQLDGLGHQNFSMKYDFFCDLDETGRLEDVLFHSDHTPNWVEIFFSTKLSCYQEVITSSCPGCNGAGYAFGVLGSLGVGFLAGFLVFTFKGKRSRKQSTYEKV
ncbi:hypothetical protein M0811_14322 [Anaeramoeba ignava]|uniref:Transmembrane protein n=1 Tax=Anaeramoeba ignava TaxID=1746090 RepID=A0A9Q0RH71_ANAIG|nr:hypothetical protein M0811_14322 [Anaeramoeba ignava]